MQMNAQWHLFGGRRQIHRAYAPFARWGSSQQAHRPPFMTGAEFSGPASHRIRASVKLTHPCQFAAAHLPCTRPPDVLYGCRPRGASMTPPAPERPSTPADLRTALRPPASFGVTLFAINVGCPADRPRTPSRIHSEDHIISQRFSPPSTGCISGGHTSLSLYW